MEENAKETSLTQFKVGIKVKHLLFSLQKMKSTHHLSLCKHFYKFKLFSLGVTFLFFLSACFTLEKAKFLVNDNDATVLNMDGVECM